MSIAHCRAVIPALLATLSGLARRLPWLAVDEDRQKQSSNKLWVAAVMLLVACIPSSRMPNVQPQRTLSVAAGAEQASEHGPFAVVDAAPTGAADPSGQIRVVFNRPLRALEVAGSEAAPPARLSPAVPGRWQWVGTSAALFVPDGGRLPGATHFAVEVPRETRALDGSVLPAPYRFEFETPRPKIVSSTPSDAQDGLEPNAEFELSFNQVVDAKEVARAVRLFAVRAGKRRPIPFDVRPIPNARKRLQLDPREPLPTNHEIELELAADFRSSEGPLPAGAAHQLRFRTYGPLRVEELTCGRDEPASGCAPRGAVGVTLSNPVRFGALKRAIRIEPTVKLRWDSYREDDDEAWSIDLVGPFEPGKRYVISVEPGLEDRYGQRLGQRFRREIAFEDYMPTVEIGVRGDYVEAAARAPIEVGSVNVGQFELATASLDEVQLAGLLSKRGPSQQYAALLKVPAQRRTVKTTGSKNAIQRHLVDANAALGTRPGALAIAVAYDQRGTPQREIKVVQVTDLAVSAKLGRERALVWVTRLGTGEPVGGAEVRIVSSQRAGTKTVVTDARGIAQLDTAAFIPAALEDPALLIVRHGADWTHRKLSDHVEPWRMNVATDVFGNDRTYGLLFTDRGIYRPGDVVKVKGVLRRETDGGNAVVTSSAATLVLRSPDWEKARTYAVKTNAFGTFAADVSVPTSAALGSWQLAIEHPDGQITTDFQIAEYRPAEFKVHAASDRPEYRRGDRARWTLGADYLYGAPMSGAAVRYSIYRSPTTFVPPGADELTTDAEVYDADSRDEAATMSTVAQATGKLDAKGALLVAQALELPAQRGPESVTVHAEVTDLSRQSLSAQSSAIVHPADIYVGIERMQDSFVAAPSVVRPRVRLLTVDGQPARGAVSLELVRRRFTLAREEAGSDVRSEVRTVDQVVGTCTAQVTAAPGSCELKVPDAGYFIVVASSKDRRGHSARAALSLYAIGSGASPWADRDSRQVDVVSNKPEYRVGDTARLLVKSPFASAEALITIETGNAREERRVRLSGPTPTVDVKVTEGMRPNAFVAIHLLRPRTAPAPSAPGKPDLGAPTYRFGYAELRVDSSARRLRVEVAPSRRNVKPGDEVVVGLKATDSAGKPHRAELTVYAVDEGVLSLTDYQVPDPLRVFTQPRPLRTALLESRDALARRGFFDLTDLLGGDKGAAGGGGGEALSPRRDFRQTAFYDPNVVTAADGTASVRFKLPDTLTTFRVMAVATSTEDRYGYGESQVTTSKRLMARPALPRQLHAGDVFDASVIVSTKQFGPTAANVSLRVTGAVVTGPAVRHVDLGRDGAVEVRFPVRVDRPGEATFRFDVAAGQERDAVEQKRRVTIPTELESVALYGKTSDTAAERIGALPGIRRDVGSLEVTMASTALVGLDSGFEQLVEYPYGCTEQLSSRLLPLLPLRGLAAALGMPLPANTARVVEKTIADLVRRQRGDGGFGMWPDSPESEAWVTAYALWVLKTAEARGAPVSGAVFERGRDFLRRELEQSNRDDLTFAASALTVYVLAEIGAPDPGYVNRLFKDRKRLPLFAQGLLLHAMVKSGVARASSGELAAELQRAIRIDADRAVVAENVGNDYAVLMDSAPRTAAIVLRALLAYDPQHVLAPGLARGLLAARRGGTWRSTQETAFALLALEAYRTAQEKAPPGFAARVWLGGRELASNSFRGGSTRSASNAVPLAQLGGGDLVFDKDGSGSLFYEARLTYARAALPTAAIDRGFFVQKTLRAVTPESLRSALTAVPERSELAVSAGSLVLADVFVVTPGPREYVVVDDPLPAGLEAIDTNLATTAAWLDLSAASSSSSAMSPDERDDALAEGRAVLSSWYRQEQRDDRVVFFVDRMAAGIYHYRYLARATTLGRFVVPATKAEEMYTPEVFGRTAGGSFEVR